MSKFKVGDRVQVTIANCVPEIGSLGVVEVKRAAKVGEWIKITCATNSCKLYENGNILKVSEEKLSGNTGVDFESFKSFTIRPSEYVVLENYQPSKPVGAKATPERIEKARRFAKLLLLDCFDREISVVFYVTEHSKTIKADLSYGIPHENKSATAKCTPEDEYNVWIGRAVALCKAVGRELPDWLIEKSE